MKIEIPKDWIMARTETDEGEIGAGSLDNLSSRPLDEQTITVHAHGDPQRPRSLTHWQYEQYLASGMLWEFYPDAPLSWPNK